MQIATGRFGRMSPAKFADRVELPMGWIVVRHSHLVSKLERRKTHGHWVAISSGQNRIYRVVRYSVNLPADKIVMDWAGWIELQGRTDDEAEAIQLTVTKATWRQLAIIPFNHIDPGYRLSAWLGAVSVGLGLLSVVLSIALSG